MRLGEDVVREAVGDHRRGLGDEVVVELIVREPCTRKSAPNLNGYRLDTHSRWGTSRTRCTP